MKRIYITLLIISSLFAAQNAKAFVTLDGVKGTGGAFKVVSDVVREAQSKVTKLQQDVLGNKFVKGTMDRIDEAKEFYNTNKANIDAGKKIYNDTAAGIKNSDVYKMGQIAAKMKEVDKKISEAEAKKAEVANVSAQNVSAMQTEIEGKISALDANTANLQAMRTQEPTRAAEYSNYINENDITKMELQDELDMFRSSEEASVQEGQKPYEQELNRLKKEKQKIALELAKFTANSFKAADAASALKNAKTAVFIKEGEPETAENVNEIRKKRFIERRDTSKEAYEAAMQAKIPLIDQEIRTSKMTTGASELDTIIGPINTDTRTKIDNARLLTLYVKLVLANMKSETAKDFANIPSYKPTGKDNVIIFNLDDYKFKKGASK